jgi:hypothetical protein
MRKTHGTRMVVALTAASFLMVGSVMGAMAKDHPGGASGDHAGAHGPSVTQVQSPGNVAHGPGATHDQSPGNAANGHDHADQPQARGSDDDTPVAEVENPATVTEPATVTGPSAPTSEGRVCPDGITTLEQAQSFDWENHGQFVSCVASGAISGVSVEDAAHSDIGKPNDDQSAQPDGDDQSTPPDADTDAD